MPRSKNYQTYSEAFHKLIEVAVLHRFEITLSSPAAAMRLRGRYYGFLAALEKELAKPDGVPDARRLRNMSMKVKVHAEKGSSVFSAFPSDEDPLNMALNEALAGKPTEGGGSAGGPVGPGQSLMDLIRQEADDSESSS